MSVRVADSLYVSVHILETGKIEIQREGEVIALIPDNCSQLEQLAIIQRDMEKREGN